jgi:hypothetical protein
MAKRFSQETKEKARAMRASGMTYVEIAGEIGCTAPCVRYWCDDGARELALAASSSWRCGQAYSELSEEERLGIESLYRTANKMSQGDLFFEVDHITPVSKGGEHRIWNLRIIPRRMNRTGRPKKN